MIRTHVHLPLYKRGRKSTDQGLAWTGGSEGEHPLLVLSAGPRQVVIHSVGVWGPKRNTLNPRRQLGEGRAQGFVSCLPHPDSSLQRCLVALAIPLCHWGQCRRRRRRKARHGSKSSALAGPQHPAWISFYPQLLQGTSLAQKYCMWVQLP